MELTANEILQKKKINKVRDIAKLSKMKDGRLTKTEQNTGEHQTG